MLICLNLLDAPQTPTTPYQPYHPSMLKLTPTFSPPGSPPPPGYTHADPQQPTHELASPVPELPGLAVNPGTHHSRTRSSELDGGSTMRIGALMETAAARWTAQGHQGLVKPNYDSMRDWDYLMCKLCEWAFVLYNHFHVRFASSGNMTLIIRMRKVSITAKRKWLLSRRNPKGSGSSTI